MAEQLSFAQQAPALIQRDHIRFPQETRNTGLIGDVDFVIATADSNGQNATRSFYDLEPDGSYQLRSRTMQTYIDYRFAWGSGHKIRHEQYPKGGSFDWKLEFNQDIDVALFGNAGAAEMTLVYRTSGPHDTAEPSKLYQLSFTPDAARSIQQADLLEKTSKSADYWDNIKRLLLYSRRHLIEGLMEKGHEELEVGGVTVVSSYDKEDDAFTVSFPLYGQEKTFVIPGSIGVVGEVKKKYFPEEGEHLLMGEPTYLKDFSPLAALGIKE